MDIGRSARSGPPLASGPAAGGSGRVGPGRSVPGGAGGTSVQRIAGECAPSLNEALRIGVLSPPMLPIPPARYAGTERIVAALVDGLHRRGHRVTLFAPGDSQVDCELVPTVPHSLWSSGYTGDLGAYLNLTLAKAWSMAGSFDIIHSHID